jgi:pantoate kinase
MPKQARAFSPAGISSFFEICDKTKNGTPISNPELIGARGGGFGLKKGVLTEVLVSENKTNNIIVHINGKIAPEAKTTMSVIKELLVKSGKTYEVTIKHKVDIPIGAGFGTSAGGALTAGLACAKALNISLTYNEIGKIAHIAEIKCKTGLGTVGPLMIGGFALTIEPGAPGISIIDHIPISDKHVIVSGWIKPIPTKQILNSEKKRQIVNHWGKKTLKKILSEPSAENFMNCCLNFAEKTGFMTQQTRQLVRLAKKAGAIGTAQNMVGEAVHTLTLQENATKITEAFNEILPKEKIFISQIDFQGARIVE